MSSRTRLLEIVFLMAVISFGLHWYRSGPLSVEGVAVGMTSQEVEQVLKRRKDRPRIDWGADQRVERVTGSHLERGGRALLGPRATYAEIVAGLGKPTRERTHALTLPGSQEESLQLLYRQERLSVERSSDGVVDYQLL